MASWPDLCIDQPFEDALAAEPEAASFEFAEGLMRAWLAWRARGDKALRGARHRPSAKFLKGFLEEYRRRFGKRAWRAAELRLTIIISAHLKNATAHRIRANHTEKD